MARSQVKEVLADLQTDTGSVLWSLVQGEQLEFPVKLNFLTIATSAYTYEAVVLEGENVEGIDSVPGNVKAVTPVKTVLYVHVPTFNAWAGATAYKAWDTVSNAGEYYRCTIDHTSGTFATDLSAGKWVVHEPNTVYIRFPKTFTVSGAGQIYAAQPTLTSSVYGFFELSVTEPGTATFPKTWKPMRGVVEILYSPTEHNP